jgi:WD40 repeat protein
MDIFEIIIQPKPQDPWSFDVEYTPSVQLALTKHYKGKFDSTQLLEIRASQGEPNAYGEKLGKALFKGHVEENNHVEKAFLEAVNTVRNNKSSILHVILYIYNDDLKDLRWERLWAPIDSEQWGCLAINEKISFSIYIKTQKDNSLQPIGKRDLKVLLVVAGLKKEDYENPQKNKYKLAYFNVEETVSSVKKSLGDIPCHVLANIADAKEPPDLDHLEKNLSLSRPPYTILHLVCHGKLLDDGDTLIYLADTKGEIKPTKTSELIKRLKPLATIPHFAFLSSCESASPEAESKARTSCQSASPEDAESKARGGLAQSLLRELGMPAVLAMTDKVSIKTAQDIAANFYPQLREHGEIGKALVKATAGLRGRTDVTVPALFSRLRGRPLFDKSLDRDPTKTDIEFGLIRFKELLPERAPTLTKSFEEQESKLRNYSKNNINALSQEAKEEWEKALKEINKLCYQVLEISFNALALGENVPGYNSRCPFKGLKAFEKEDAEFFSGREDLVEILKTKLNQPVDNYKFLAVLGSSGSGKSSVVKAGLIPVLKNDDSNIQEKILTPSKEPHKELESKLSEIQEQSSSVLVIDQFEELFTLCEDEEQRKDFVNELLTFATKPKQKVVITMRADFWGECARYENLKYLMQKNQELISPMTPSQMREAIEEPAKKVGLRFEAGLINLILNELEDEPGALPLLQHTLLELWKRRHGRNLVCDEYDEIGRVKGAIAKTADDFCNNLASNEEREKVKSIFLRLTRLDENAGKHDIPRDTRRRVDLKDLSSGYDLKEIKLLVDCLADKRLVVTNVITNKEQPIDEDAEITVEVAHEALIRYWTKLQHWLTTDRTNLLFRQDIEKQASNWNNNQEKEDDLVLQGSRLKDAEKLMQQRGFFNKQQIEYVKACAAKRDRQKGKEIEQYLSTYTGYSKALFVLNQRLDALVELIKAGKRLQEGLEEGAEITADKKFQFLVTFGQIFSEVAEFNILDGHESFVSSVSFSPDNQMIVSGSHDGILHLWNRDGTLIQTLEEHEDEVTGVTFSPDGQLLVSVSKDKTIKFWHKPKIKKGKTYQQLDLWILLNEIQEAHSDSIWGVSFSPDNQIIASASEDKTIKLWHRNGHLLETLEGHEGGVTAVSFSRDGQKIASASQDKTVRLWDLTDKSKSAKILDDHLDVVSAVSFSPDGQTLISSSWDGFIRIWDLDGNLRQYLQDKESIFCATFSQDGKRIASAREDGAITIWKEDGNRFRSVKTLKKHSASITKVSFSPDKKSRIIVSSSFDETLKLWHDNSKFVGHSENIFSINFSVDGRTIATVSEDRTIKLWKRNGRLIKTIDVHDENIIDIKFCPQEEAIGILGEDGTIRFWSLDRDTDRPYKIFQGHKSQSLNISFSPDGKIVATANADGTVILSSLTGDFLRTLEGHSSLVNIVTFSPCGQIIATASYDKTVKLWKLDGTLYRTFNTNRNPAEHVIFSPDGKIVVIVSDNEIELWNNAEFQPAFEGKAESFIKSITFINDGRMIASIGHDKTVNLWKVNGEAIPSLLPNIKANNDSVVYSAAFSPDGSAIAVANSEHRIDFWELNLNKILRYSSKYLHNYIRKNHADDRLLNERKN